MISRRKGELAIEWGGMEMLEIVLLFMFMVFVAKAAVAALNPDEQVVMINVNLLKNKLDEACTTGYSSMSEFNFPQPSPPRFAGLVDVFAQMAIRSSGDPQYLLYYEAFPPGEAVGWETYQNLNSRVITPIDLHTTETTVADFKAKMETHLQSVQNNVKTILGQQSTSTPILINNVKLSNYLNVNPTEEPSRTGNTDKLKLGNAGDWKEDKFIFYSYNTLSSLDQSSIKYRVCGPNSLCLKTRAGVYVFPLSPNCAGKYIQLNYDATSTSKTAAFSVATLAVPLAAVGALPTTAVTTALGTTASYTWSIFKFAPTIVGSIFVALSNRITEAVFKWALTYKVSDFYVASPCKLNSLEFQKDTCDNVYSYPIYNDDPIENKVTDKGIHYTSLDSIPNKDGNLVNGRNGVDCIKIRVSQPRDGYCWTPNPDTSKIKYFSTGVLTKIIVDTASSTVGVTPVSHENSYANNPFMYILNPSDNSISYSKKAAEFVGNLWSWKWPSGGF